VTLRALRRAAVGLALVAAAVLAARAARATAPAAGGPAAPLRLTIAFTGDVSGYLEPCG
jgi:hypothetical protein